MLPLTAKLMQFGETIPAEKLNWTNSRPVFLKWLIISKNIQSSESTGKLVLLYSIWVA